MSKQGFSNMAFDWLGLTILHAGNRLFPIQTFAQNTISRLTYLHDGYQTIHLDQ